MPHGPGAVGLAAPGGRGAARLPGRRDAGRDVTSKYNGIAGDHLGAYDPVYGGYAFYVPLLYADQARLQHVMYIQNGGLECTLDRDLVQGAGQLPARRICDVLTLAPGETFQFDAVGLRGRRAGWAAPGSAHSQPLGIVVDIVGPRRLMTYIGVPAELNYTFDRTPATYRRPGNQVAYGPLIYSEYQGWDTGVQVQNLSP